MSFVNTVISLIIYLVVLNIIVTFGMLIIEFVNLPARRREYRSQEHAAILQAATRRKLSMRRPISPHRLNRCKPTKSATRTNNIARPTHNYYSD